MSDLVFKQFYLGCLAHASYLVGDRTTGVACVVDPQRDIEQYIAFAGQHDLRIAHVVLTHFHADFVAGHIELRDRTGAAIYLGAGAEAEYAFTPLADGDEIRLGTVRMRALATPGHTAESISLLVFDPSGDLPGDSSGDAPGNVPASDAPYAVLTGDTLFVGDVGRPDLRVALGWSAADLASRLYDSLHKKLLPLPDATLVYPAHGAGSLCGKAIGKETYSTIGEQRRANYALQPMSREAFVALVTADQPEAPSYFTFDAVLNTRERPTLDESLSRELRGLSLDAVVARQREGAYLIDTRDFNEFAAVHVRGSINIPLGGSYATTAGTVLDARTAIVLITEPGAERESAMRLGRVGLDRVIGFLEGGLAAVNHRPDLLTMTERVSAPLAADRLAGPAPPLVLDVRTPAERQEKRIAGSISIPLNHLASELTALPTDRPLLVHCAGGYRSSVAASLLQRAGFTQVGEIAGSLAAWETAGLPLETS